MMHRIYRFGLHVAIVFAGLAGTSGTGLAQGAPYSLTDVLQLVQAGISSSRILQTIDKSCISFRVTQDVEAVLRGASADAALLPGLRKLCFKGTEVPTVKPDKIPVVPRTIVKHDTVSKMVVRHDTVSKTVVRHDTVVLYNPVVPARPSIAVPVDLDFHYFKNAYTQSDSNCVRSYRGELYALTRPPGSSMVCGTFWKIADTSATVIMEASFARSELGPPYAYGISFAVDDTSSYNFQIQVQDGIAHQRLTHLVRGNWTFLTSDTESSAIDFGGNNRMRVEVRDSGIDMYINGRLVANYVPPKRARGEWYGVAQYGTGPGTLLINSVRLTQSSQ